MATNDEEIAALKAQLGQLSVAVEILAEAFLMTTKPADREWFRRSLVKLAEDVHERPDKYHSGFYGRDFGDIDIGPVRDFFLGLLE